MQVQSMSAEEFPGCRPIGQVLGMDARPACIGQSDLLQHDAEAQQVFAPGFTARGTMACAHQRVSATSINHALCGRDILLSYHTNQHRIGIHVNGYSTYPIM